MESDVFGNKRNVWRVQYGALDNIFLRFSVASLKHSKSRSRKRISHMGCLLLGHGILQSAPFLNNLIANFSLLEFIAANKGDKSFSPASKSMEGRERR